MIRHLLIACAVAALSACATGAGPGRTPVDASMGAAPARLAGYVSSGALDGKAIIGPPPAPGSPRDQADHALFDETRALQGSPRWKTAIQDSDLWRGGALSRFSCALGVSVDERQTPTTLKILRKVELDVRTVGTPAKDFYDRKRPLIGNDKPICVPREAWMQTNASYPSGHSMTAWAWALILAEAAPSRADAVLELGRDSGDSRMICGVHFMTDVEAGRTLGAAMVARLHAEPVFQADMAVARRELASARTAPAGCAG